MWATSYNTHAQQASHNTDTQFLFLGMCSLLFHLNAWVYVFPRDGEWSQEQYDQVLKGCKRVTSLRSATRFSSHHGFRFALNSRVREFQQKIPAAKNHDLGPDVRIHQFEFNFKNSSQGVRCIQLIAKYGVSLTQMVDITRVFQENGHCVLGIRGFHYPSPTLTIDRARHLGLPLTTVKTHARHRRCSVR